MTDRLRNAAIRAEWRAGHSVESLAHRYSLETTQIESIFNDDNVLRRLLKALRRIVSVSQRGH